MQKVEPIAMAGGIEIHYSFDELGIWKSWYQTRKTEHPPRAPAGPADQNHKAPGLARVRSRYQTAQTLLCATMAGSWRLSYWVYPGYRWITITMLVRLNTG